MLLRGRSLEFLQELRNIVAVTGTVKGSQLIFEQRRKDGVVLPALLWTFGAVGAMQNLVAKVPLLHQPFQGWSHAVRALRLVGKSTV